INSQCWVLPKAPMAQQLKKGIAKKPENFIPITIRAIKMPKKILNWPQQARKCEVIGIKEPVTTNTVMQLLKAQVAMVAVSTIWKTSSVSLEIFSEVLLAADLAVSADLAAVVNVV